MNDSQMGYAYVGKRWMNCMWVVGMIVRWRKEIGKSGVKRHFYTNPGKEKKARGCRRDNVWIWMELSQKAIESKVDDERQS